MNKRIGLLLISEAYPKPLARWNCEAIYKEMCNFIKEHKMQEKVTLKVGDILAKTIDYVNHPIMTIVRFEADKIILNHDGGYWRRDLTQHGYKFYVNGKPYASENIIVPDFKKENKMEYQEITPENIAEVLKFNGIDKKLYTVQAKHIDCYTKCGNYCDIFNFNNQLWLQLVEVHFGKLKPLPKANPFDVVKVGDWVKSKKTLYHYQCQLPYRTKDKWYQRVELNNKKCFVCNSNGSGYSSSDYSPCDWDLTDIRDYNPTECELKVGDVIDFGSYGNLPIDEFNYIDECIETNLGGSLICRGFKNLQNNDNKKSQLINSKACDKITIPKFDFVKCLVDAGFTLDGDGDLYAIGSSWNESIICLEKKDDRQWFLNCSSNLTEATPANAQIIVSMANLAKGIK